MNIGGMSRVFIATIDVPQKKNGLMRSAASTACDSAVELDMLVDASAAATLRVTRGEKIGEPTDDGAFVVGG